MRQPAVRPAPNRCDSACALRFSAVATTPFTRPSKIAVGPIAVRLRTMAPASSNTGAAMALTPGTAR